MLGNLKDAADVIEGITKTVPIYQDLLQPAMQELGKGVHTLAKTVNIALAPISAFVWSYDTIKDFIQQSLVAKLGNIPQENIISPAPEVAVPAIAALRYLGHKEELRDMFSNLLATSMNSESAKMAHPSFVEIIKQLSSDEAKILKFITNNNFMPIIDLNRLVDGTNFSIVVKNFTVIQYNIGCEFPELGASYIENINRLGLIHIDNTTPLTDKTYYNDLENHIQILSRIKQIADEGMQYQINKFLYHRTSFGQKFYNACIKETT